MRSAIAVERVQHVVADPAQEDAVVVEPELGGLALEVGLGGPGAGHDEAHVPEPLDHARERLERQLETLLVNQPPDQQHEPLIGLCEARAEGVQVVHGHQLGGVDAVGDHGDPVLLEAVDVGHVLAHVGGAGDDPLSAVGHPSLDAVDVGLRVLVDPPLMAAVLGRVDGDHQRAPEALGQVVAGHRHEPVVPVYEIEAVAVPDLHARGQHVRVHVLDPGHELGQVAGPLGLAHAVDDHPVQLLLGR